MGVFRSRIYFSVEILAARSPMTFGASGDGGIEKAISRRIFRATCVIFLRYRGRDINFSFEHCPTSDFRLIPNVDSFLSLNLNSVLIEFLFSEQWLTKLISCLSHVS